MPAVSSTVCVYALVAATVGVVLLMVFCPTCLLGLLALVVVWVMLEEIGGRR